MTLAAWEEEEQLWEEEKDERRQAPLSNEDSATGVRGMWHTLSAV